MASADYTSRGAVAVITLDNQPVNALGLSVRRGVADGLERAAGDASVGAVVLTGAGATFCGGADVSEFGLPAMSASPHLTDLCQLVEGFPKPVIAALNGLALGGGLELAMCCHYRVALATAQVGLPEVKLGILPGAGGTQRLPRLAGPERALNMIVSGTPVTARELASTALFDEVVESDVVSAAIAYAGRAVEAKLPLKKARDIKIQFPNAEAFFDFARGAVAPLAKNYPAPGKCIDAVEAAVLKPFDEGMRIERAAFTELLSSTESKALRHVFFAIRAASKIPDVPSGTPLRPVESVAIIGAGTMGGGIAMNFANAGVPVTVLETGQAALDKGLGVVRKNYEGTLKKGRLTQKDFDKRLGLIRGTLSYDDIAQADLVIEAVFEDMQVKQRVFETLDAKMKPGAILASNTSTLDLDKIASFTRRPGDVVGLHFFSPANVTKLLEIVRGAKTAKDVLATSLGIAKQIKKIGVVSGVCDGFIGNRMLNAYFRQMDFLLDAGALPAQIDKALEAFGFAMGPFRVSDLAGNDIGWAIRKRLYAEHPDRAFSKIPDRICELGRFGQKTGAGWYDYKPGERNALPSDVVTNIILEESSRLGLPRRKIGDAEIVERALYALINEGARILEEGIAQRS
jgi:3-hydroxyacyl-CoA dehydrogenase